MEWQNLFRNHNRTRNHAIEEASRLIQREMLTLIDLRKKAEDRGDSPGEMASYNRAINGLDRIAGKVRRLKWHEKTPESADGGS